MASSILVVDRDPDWQRDLTEHLRPYILTVMTANRSAQALDILRSRALDLVILDAGLLDVSTCMAAAQSHRRPSLLVTVDGPCYETILEALRARARDVLERPVPVERAVARLTEILEEKVVSPHYLGRRLDRFIAENCCRRDLNLTRLSRTFGISEGYASMLLNWGPWKGFRQRLSYHRVAQARRLLQDGDAPLYEIAEVCGFASPSRFSETFSRLMGLPPKRYREHARSNPRRQGSGPP